MGEKLKLPGILPERIFDIAYNALPENPRIGDVLVTQSTRGVSYWNGRLWSHVSAYSPDDPPRAIRFRKKLIAALKKVGYEEGLFPPEKKLKSCPIPECEGEADTLWYETLVCCSNSTCEMRKHGITRAAWESLLRPSRTAQEIAVIIEHVEELVYQRLKHQDPALARVLTKVLTQSVEHIESLAAPVPNL